ncbi:MAG: lipopolysaccharide kinase InaA family protein [Leptotrichiaceae bacterium]|nr:lipopolysaccharide kinase InaA family protein [Leptotrichiaceae bacterium]
MIKEQNYKIKENYDEDVLSAILDNFDIGGEIVAQGGRNLIKKFKIVNNGQEKEINIKKFGKKNILTQFVYKFFTGSKAKRSYEFANMLLGKNIKTPKPIAYFDDYVNKETGEKRSFYISEELKYDFTCREVFWNEEMTPDMKVKMSNNRNEVIRQFAEFTFDLHEKGIKFEDFSPGNVLIKRENNGKYGFYLVDLNRMKFYEKLDFNTRMKNVSRMMEFKIFVEEFSKEYAKLYRLPYKKIFEKLYYYVTIHKYRVLFKDNTRFLREIFRKKKN